MGDHRRQQAIIILTVYDWTEIEEDRQKTLDAGLNGHIVKPIDIANLIAVLKGALK